MALDLGLLAHALPVHPSPRWAPLPSCVDVPQQLAAVPAAAAASGAASSGGGDDVACTRTALRAESGGCAPH